MMNKLKLLILVCTLFVFSYNLSNTFKSAILGLNDFIISKSYETYENIKNNINKYFNQVNEIRELRIELEKTKKYENLYNNLIIEYNALAKLHNLKNYNFKLDSAMVLGYEKLGNLTRFWMDYDAKANKVYGLVYDKNAVGVMYLYQNRAYALSLNDEKCAFSVSVGKNKIPAIVQGGKNTIYVNFITDYKELNIDDEVYTSGKDMIFSEGIYVGKIAKIIDEAGYKKAILKDTKVLKPLRYVYVVNNSL